jgi:3-oxoacyl-[acyl-carrier-protein] synthase I
MSSPHPQGAGAALAMRAALEHAGLPAAAVGYLNLHGTGTPSNDAAEDTAVCDVFGTELPCSSTKGFTGHTLGAAGGVEAAISMLALQYGLLPAGLNVAHPDAGLRANYLLAPRQQAVPVVASNSFGFGGTNACLLFGAASFRGAA